MDPALWPEEFREAVGRMDAAAVRPEVSIESMPAPQRIAPLAEPRRLAAGREGGPLPVQESREIIDPVIVR